MGKRWIVTEDDGSDGVIGLFIAVVVIAFLLFALVWIGIPVLIGYIIYRVYKYQKKQNELEPTRCPRCRKVEALTLVKTEVVKSVPITKTIQNKDTLKTERIGMMENTTRRLEECKFCNEITFSDTVTRDMR